MELLSRITALSRGNVEVLLVAQAALLLDECPAHICCHKKKDKVLVFSLFHFFFRVLWRHDTRGIVWAGRELVESTWGAHAGKDELCGYLKMG